MTTNFAGQWLHLRNLASVKPDPERFPGFDNDLRDAMQRETELFFEAIRKENRSVLEFLDSRFTYLNARLGHLLRRRWRGRSPIFAASDLPDGSRGGVMTMASVLAVTSYPTRTSPVIRGKWVLENLLGAPPPPPPPDVPALPEAGLGKTHVDATADRAASREPSPAPRAMRRWIQSDSLWKTTTPWAAFALKTAASISMQRASCLRASRSSNAAELKQILRAQPEEFVLCFSEKLLDLRPGAWSGAY